MFVNKTVKGDERWKVPINKNTYSREKGATCRGCRGSLGRPLSVWRMRRVAASRACSKDSLSSS